MIARYPQIKMEMTVFESLILINKAIHLAFGELQYEVEWLRSKPWCAALLHTAYIDRIRTEMAPLHTLLLNDIQIVLFT